VAGSEDPREGPLAPARPDLGLAYTAGGPPGGHGRAEAVLSDGDGLAVLATVTVQGGRERTSWLRLDDHGEVGAHRELGEEHGAGRAMAALPGGAGYVVAGELPTGPLSFRATLLRLDIVGELQSSETLGEDGDTGLSAVAVLADRTIIAGGTSGERGWLVRGRGETHPDGASETELDGLRDVVAVARTSGGGVIAAAVRERSTTSLGTCALVALDDRLGERWRVPLPDDGAGQLRALTVTADGAGIIAAGDLEPAEGGDGRLWVVRVDPAGEVVWDRRLQIVEAAHYGRAIVALPGGDLVVAGDAAGEPRQMLAARLSAAGEVVWSRGYEPGDELVRAAVATAKAIIVAGSGLRGGSDSRRALVTALGPDGELRWSRSPAIGLAD
jgi:hypothetical protein